MSTILDGLEIAIVRPGGNDTALVKGIILDPNKKKIINDAIMKKRPSIEQVGFYSYNQTNNTAVLEMAGGEFCGNATRALAYLLLKGKKGEITVKVSGAKSLLAAGVKKPGTAFASMPIYKSYRSVTLYKSNLIRVNLQGITHLISPLPKDMSKTQLIQNAKKLLSANGLLTSLPAAGVMYVSQRIRNEISIDPIVWVRDIQTLFYETACASGSTAVGLWQAKCFGKKSMAVLQPSVQTINVFITNSDSGFESAYIDGSIRLITKLI